MGGRAAAFSLNAFSLKPPCRYLLRPCTDKAQPTARLDHVGTGGRHEQLRVRRAGHGHRPWLGRSGTE